MNLRAIGCMAAGAVLFIGVGLFGLSLAMGPEGCPERIQWAEVGYLPDGPVGASPTFDGPEEPVLIGQTFLGLTTRDVYGPAGTAPSTAASDRPERIALDCGDGTFLHYRRIR